MQRLILTFASAISIAVLGGPPTIFAKADTQTLTVTASSHSSYDRVTLTFSAMVPQLTTTADATPPYGIGSGKDHPIPGCTYYIHTHGYAALDHINNQAASPALPVVRGVRTQYFEAELAIDVGLAYPTTYRLSRSGNQVTIEVDL
jgi:hypothetical protein